jgi:hypothetical protein
MPSKRKRVTRPYPESPNATKDLPTRLQYAKAFLEENPDEDNITAALIHDIEPTTLNSYLSRLYAQLCGGQNKILNECNESWRSGYYHNG